MPFKQIELPSGSPDLLARHSVARRLLTVVDGGLAAVILGAPWFMGGRHPLGELVLVTLAVLVAAAWGIRQMVLRGESGWTRSPVEWLFAAAVGLVLVQLLRLPPSVVEVLSPGTVELLPLWRQAGSASFGFEPWDRVSMNPAATTGSLVILFCYGLLLVVAVQRMRKVEDVEAIVGWLAISVTLLSVFAIAQYLASNGKFFWIYQHPLRDTRDAVKGPFMNKNHFAHLLALGIGPLIWWVQKAMQVHGHAAGTRGNDTLDWRRQQLSLVLRLGSLGLVLFAGLMTLSRGGTVAMLCAAGVSVATLVRAKLLDKTLLCGLALSFALMAAALAIHGYQRVSMRVGDLASGSIDSLDQHGHRRLLWLADLEGCRDFYRFGAGIGSHRDVYPMYFDHPVDLEFTHAENGPLQIALEAGMPGVVLLVVGVGLCARWCLGVLWSAASERAYLCAAAVSAALAASLAHSLVDFVWYIPSLMAITVLLIACAFRLWQFGTPSARSVAAQPRPGSWWSWASVSAAVVLVGPWMISNRFCAAMASPHWDQYLAYALARDESTGRAAVPDPSTLDHLQRVLYWTPADAHAHLRLAQAYLRRFDHVQKTAENAMPLSQIRDAAVQARFASRAALDEWMSRAIGPPRLDLDAALWHAHCALRHCPLLGEAYLYFGDLGFLRGAAAGAKSACVVQALQVRPHSGEVLLAAGGDAALSGDLERAIEYWRGALETERAVQIALVNLLIAHRVPLENIIAQFQPKLPVVRLLVAGYTAASVPEDQMRPLLEYYTQLGLRGASQDTGEDTAALWLELHDVYRRLNEREKMLDCLRHALRGHPNDYETHYMLGVCLVEDERFEEAEKRLRWCLHRRPENKHLQEMLSHAVKQRIARSGPPPAAQPPAQR